MPNPARDWSETTQGNLTVLRRVGSDSGQHALWEVQCACGSPPFVIRAGSLARGTGACRGCVARNASKKRWEYRQRLIRDLINLGYSETSVYRWSRNKQVGHIVKFMFGVR